MGVVYKAEDLDLQVPRAVLGEMDSAFTWLEKAYDQGDIVLVHLKDYLIWPKLFGSDLRYAELLKRIGLEDS